ncbi:MAG: Transcription factor 7-like 2, partial [Marteilia pararefringens]
KYDYMPINDTYLSPINLYSRPNASAHHHHGHDTSSLAATTSSSNNKSQSRQFLPTTLSSLAPGGGSGSKKKSHDLNHVKKPLNAFMIFMKEQRQKYIDQYEVKQSALINQIMAKDWKQMSEADQKPYYDKAKEQRKLHKQMYPDQYSTPSGKKKSSVISSGKTTANSSSPETAIELLRDQHKRKLKSSSNSSSSTYNCGGGTETNYNYPVPSSPYSYGPSWMQCGESPMDMAPTAPPLNYYQHNLRQNAMFHSITPATKSSMSKDASSEPWQQHGAIMGAGSGSRLSNFEPNYWPYSSLTSMPSEYSDPPKSDYCHQNFYRSPMLNCNN